MAIKSPLHDEHVALGARMVAFGGWDMPIQYAGVIAEHKSVRSGAGLFDVSHLGKITVPEGGISALDNLLPGKVTSIGPGRAAYNLVLDDSCGIVDDIFIYRRPDELLVVPNASNTPAVLEILLAAGIPATDSRFEWGILALSGPKAREIVEPVVSDAVGLKFHRFIDTTFRGIPVLLARTGYTGEFTYEFFSKWGDTPGLWEALMTQGSNLGLEPAGLGARDTLRLEMGYPLHGNDISTETNPIEAGLDWVIQWGKGSKYESQLESIKAGGVTRTLTGLLGKGREIPRSHYDVLKDDEKIGEVTSGNFSPVLNTGIALAYVRPEFATPGTMLSIAVRDKRLQAEVTQPPFVGD